MRFFSIGEFVLIVVVVLRNGAQKKPIVLSAAEHGIQKDYDSFNSSRASIN